MGCVSVCNVIKCKAKQKTWCWDFCIGSQRHVHRNAYKMGNKIKALACRAALGFASPCEIYFWWQQKSICNATNHHRKRLRNVFIYAIGYNNVAATMSKLL